MKIYQQLKNYLNKETFFRKDLVSGKTLFNVHRISVIMPLPRGYGYYEFLVDSEERREKISKLVVKARNLLRILILLPFLPYLYIIIRNTFNFNSWDDHAQLLKYHIPIFIVSFVSWYIWFGLKLDRLTKDLKKIK